MPDFGRDDTTLGWVELAELIRDGETTLLNLLALLRGVDPDVSTTTSVTLSAEETTEVLRGCEAIGQWADVVVGRAASLRPHDVEIRRRDLHREARAMLASGVADVHRLLLLARCLTVNEGFRALAESLRCTDCHESWIDTTVGEVLSAFHGSDARVVRRIAEEALLSPVTRWEACDRMQITRLAHALERFTAKAPCR